MIQLEEPYHQKGERHDSYETSSHHPTFFILGCPFGDCPGDEPHADCIYACDYRHCVSGAVTLHGSQHSRTDAPADLFRLWTSNIRCELKGQCARLDAAR